MNPKPYAAVWIVVGFHPATGLPAGPGEVYTSRELAERRVESMSIDYSRRTDGEPLIFGVVHYVSPTTILGEKA